MLSKLNVLLCVSFSLFFSVGAFASEVHQVNGQSFKLDNVEMYLGKLTNGSLAEKTDIIFGVNSLRSVPQGTKLYFRQRLDGDFYISLVVISQEFVVQKWKADGVELNLNCSPIGVDSVRVVSFYENGGLKGRCVSVSEKNIATPRRGFVTLAVGAEVFLTKNGKLESATKVKKGYVYINDQKIRLRSNSFLDFNPNGGLHFLYLAQGESFHVPTSISEETKFKQFDYEKSLPFIFYPNGSIESGRAAVEENISLEVLVWNKTYSFNFISTQMGFDDKGRLDRAVLKDDLEIVLDKNQEFNFISERDREVVFATLRAGESFPIERGRFVFLTYAGDKAVLEGFPIIAQGEKFFLSLK